MGDFQGRRQEARPCPRLFLLRKPHQGDCVTMSAVAAKEEVKETEVIHTTVEEEESSSMLDKFIPRVKAEEDPEEEEEDEEDLVDPAVEIKERCAADHCAKYQARLDECNERVTSKSNTSETCLEEIMDFYHCMDHCAAKDIFTKVKLIQKCVYF